jgi:hypothetical protein
MWEGVIDYGRLEFQRHPENESRLWEAFDRVSGTHHVICLCDGGKVRWCYQPPSGDNLFGLSGWGPSTGLLVRCPFCIDGFTHP